MLAISGMLQEAGLTPDVVTFSAVINAMSRSGLEDQVAVWYEKACDAGVGKDSRLQEVLVNAGLAQKQSNKR